MLPAAAATNHHAGKTGCRLSLAVNEACVPFHQTSHTRPRVQLASGFPCALFVRERDETSKIPGTWCRGTIWCVSFLGRPRARGGAHNLGANGQECGQGQINHRRLSPHIDCGVWVPACVGTTIGGQKNSTKMAKNTR